MPEETTEGQEEMEVQAAPEVVEEQPQETPAVQETPEVVEEVKAGGQVLVICGKDQGMNQAVTETLAKFNLTPVLLGANQELTGAVLDASALAASFVIAILSDDDVATPREEFPRNALFQPRAEEIFLLGFLVAKLGTKNMFLLSQAKQNFKQPFQHASLTYTSYDKENRWQFDLVRRLKSAGIEVDANKLI